VQAAAGATGEDNALSIHTISPSVTQISKIDYVLAFYKRAYQPRSSDRLTPTLYSRAGNYLEQFT
jgi:hypothetical protein